MINKGSMIFLTCTLFPDNFFVKLWFINNVSWVIIIDRECLYKFHIFVQVKNTAWPEILFAR